MALATNRRSIMTLFSGPMDYDSHQVRLVLAEKGVSVEIENVYAYDNLEDLIDLNPYNSLPTLVDRELVIYDACIIMEYLDERFPHPPLMPVYPVARAESRRNMYRVRKDLYSLVHTIERGSDDDANVARAQLKDALISISQIFAEKPYFLSDEFSLVDCTFAPLLWRLPEFEVDIKAKEAPGLTKYMEMVFSRPSFRKSMSEEEMEMREVFS
ncbi:MAG: glutathione S-transferase N-terminal domain-containing protein [Gammaproteobacteria bacterium]